MSTTVYLIDGITDEHDVKIVTDAIRALPGVTEVEVEFGCGEATVTSDAPLETDAVRAAVEDAGFEFVLEE